MLAALRDRDGRVTIPGFYDDVVPLTAEERQQFAALAVRRAAIPGSRSASAAIGGEAGFHDAGAPLGPADVRHQRPVERLSGRRGQNGPPGPGGGQVQLPPRAAARSAQRSPPPSSGSCERCCPPGIRNGADRHARGAGRGRAAGQPLGGGRQPGHRAGLRHAGRSSCAKGARSRSWRPFANCWESIRYFWAGGWTTTTRTARTKNSRLADFQRGIAASAYLWEELAAGQKSAWHASTGQKRLTSTSTSFHSYPDLSRSMLDRRFVLENADLVRRNCAERGSQADVDRFVALETDAQGQAGRAGNAQPPRQRSQQVDRQGQGRGRARRPQGRRPAAARSDHRGGRRNRHASPPKPTRSSKPFPICRIPTRRAVPTIRPIWKSAAASTPRPSSTFSRSITSCWANSWT